jgi:ectoine hydroxylase-related dioxygenase (phytanoyl-CoA dioxygenase family)
MKLELVLDDGIRESLSRDGYACISLLSAEDVAELLALYRELSSGMSSGFYTTLWSGDLEYRHRVNAGISRVLGKRLQSFLGPAKFVLTQFAVKQGGHSGTEVPLHQDWSMCDESQNSCVSVWCPLVDVNETNGPLAVVPGSHRVASRVRPNMPADFYYSPVAPLYDIFAKQHLRELPMRAGDAVFYDGALTHGSRPNQSAADRVAVVAALMPRATQVLHYWMPSRTKVEVFAVEDDFYSKGVTLGSRPSNGELKDVLTLSAEEPAVTHDDFLRAAAGAGADPSGRDSTAATHGTAGRRVSPRQGFVDPGRQSRLEQCGYEVVTLFSPADLDHLRSGYARIGDLAGDGFHATMYSRDAEYRRAVFDLVAPLVTERIRGVFNGYRIRVANWVVKEAGQRDSTVWFHQDWSFVDERRVRSINLWFPLLDVNEENGCLEVVAGSHLVSNEHRSHADPCRFDSLTPTLRAGYTKAVPMRAGQGIFYDGALLHSSAHNRSSARRVAVGTVLVPEDTDVVHCYRTSPTAVEVFAVDETFFWRHTPGTRPEGVPSLGMASSGTSQHDERVLGSLTRAVAIEA